MRVRFQAIEAVAFDTDRLAFRRWHERHRAPFAAMKADLVVMRHFPSTLTREPCGAGIGTWTAQFERVGCSNWAVEDKPTGGFLGFNGLSVPRRQLPFSPCVEIGWRLCHPAWVGASRPKAHAVLRVGFERMRLDEIVSFTMLANEPSRRVMQRIGMADPHADFEQPAVPAGHRLRLHLPVPTDAARLATPLTSPAAQRRTAARQNARFRAARTPPPCPARSASAAPASTT